MAERRLVRKHGVDRICRYLRIALAIDRIEILRQRVGLALFQNRFGFDCQKIRALVGNTVITVIAASEISVVQKTRLNAHGCARVEHRKRYRNKAVFVRRFGGKTYRLVKRKIAETPGRDNIAALDGLRYGNAARAVVFSAEEIIFFRFRCFRSE